jgi:hypothetical protein
MHYNLIYVPTAFEQGSAVRVGQDGFAFLAYSELVAHKAHNQKIAATFARLQKPDVTFMIEICGHRDVPDHRSLT